jgi:hypothetical protein
LGAKAPAVPEQSSVTFQSSETFQRSEPEQAKKQTNSPQTRANTRFRALNAQEGSREQREKNGGMRAWNGDIRRCVLKRPRPKTAPTLAFRAKKIPTDKGWDFGKWWRADAGSIPSPSLE